MRQATIRLARRAAGSLVLAGALVGGLALPGLPAGASGGASDPPGWTGATPGEWVAFTVSPPTAVPIGRTGTYEPVKITRNNQLTTTSIDDAFGDWPVSDHDMDPATPDQRGWPGEWKDGNVTLTRVAWCAATSDVCDYHVTEPGPFHFAGGEPPDDGTGNPDYALFPPAQTITQDPPPEINITFGWSPAGNRAPANGTTPGKLMLSADASDALATSPADLRYDWQIALPDGTVLATKQGKVVEFDLDQDGVYCVGLTVTNVLDSHSKAYYGVFADGCQFVDQVTPGTLPGPGPGPGPGNGGGNGGGSVGGGAGGGINVVFAPPRRGSSALTGTAGGDSVVWLWRPEYFQPGQETTQALPQTGRNPLEGRTDIVIATDPAPDSNAAPMLAGLGIFGLVGVGWLFSRWRRVQGEV